MDKYEGKIFGDLEIISDEKGLNFSIDKDIVLPYTLNGFQEVENIIKFLTKWKEDNFKSIILAEELRKKYLFYIKQAELTDSKKEDEVFRKHAQELLNELQSICPHEDVVLLNNSEPAFQTLNDYFPAEPEDRKCLMCNMFESNFNTEDFQKLKNVKWKTIKFKDKKSLLTFLPEILQPLNFNIHECRHAAARGL